MKIRTLTMLALCAQLGLAATSAPVAAPAPYAGQENRAIKALSAEEIDAYLAGKGMGLAKAGELNGYPGPAHVLELAAELELSPAQRQSTAALFATMQAEARSLGRALIGAETRLDTMFANQTITPESLSSSLQEIASVQARLRGVHLRAHLAEAHILSAEQNAMYARLRGYADHRSHEHGALEH